MAVLEFLVKHGAFNFGFDSRSSPHYNSPASSVDSIDGSRSSACSPLEYSDSEEKAWSENSLLKSPDVVSLLLKGPFEPITPVHLEALKQPSPTEAKDNMQNVAADNESDGDSLPMEEQHGQMYELEKMLKKDGNENN